MKTEQPASRSDGVPTDDEIRNAIAEWEGALYEEIKSDLPPETVAESRERLLDVLRRCRAAAIPSERPDIYRDLWERFVSLQTGDATLLVQDAARYRWLRSAHPYSENTTRMQRMSIYCEFALDGAIDLSMAESNERPDSSKEKT